MRNAGAMRASGWTKTITAACTNSGNDGGPLSLVHVPGTDYVVIVETGHGSEQT